ncbi:Ubiquinol-cytochrome C chaperone [hydrothermal vent metagenome]|uniref:Ubiquinol-cytochrome C chaperone n=1 Tax=hydrothermal vent metagenome TaxID=652676 RepID=A0A3B0TZV7_9ZZZZ
MLRRLLGGSKDDPRPKAIYTAIMAASRQPVFYSKLGVADTLEGRFELLVLHGILLSRRFAAGGGAAKAMSQEVFDFMFADLDQALREAGVGDLAVPRRIRRMAEIYYGRARAYGVALEHDAPSEALLAVVERNVFGAPAGPETHFAGAQNVAALARYIKAADDGLARTEEALLFEGKLNFPPAGDFVPAPDTMAIKEGAVT